MCSSCKCPCAARQCRPVLNKRIFMSCNMKALAIIMTWLVLQTSASFVDDFRGAVSSVESSFENLLSDVIYDVRETIDCTLMAVEQVLALGVFGDPTEYDARCGGGAEVEQPVVEAVTEAPPPPVQETTHYISIPLTKKEHKQVDSSILDVDQVLCDVLKKDKTYSQLETVKLALENETERLTEISELLKKQLEELSAEVKEKFKAIELQTSEPSVVSIWNDIKLLHEIEHRHKNTDDAMKISHVLDQILSILDANEEHRSAADDYKVQQIMRKLSKQTTGGDSDIWKDIKDYPKDFRDYAKRVFDENRSTLPPDETTKKPESDGENKKGNDEKKSENDKKEADKMDKSKDYTHTTVKPKRKKKPARTTTTTTEKPLTLEELAAEYGSLFDVMPDIDSIDTKKAVQSAKNIIEDTKLNDAVINSLAEIDTSKEARDLFDDPDLLGDETMIRVKQGSEA